MRQIFRIRSTFWNRALLIGLLFVFLFSVFKLFEYRMESSRNNQVYDDLRKAKTSLSNNDSSHETLSTSRQGEHRRTNQPARTMPALTLDEGFLPLLKRNSDSVGWIHIPGTRIDYPVVQSDDNKYYLNRNFDRKPSIFGAIFMDYRNAIHTLGAHSILYGHHMNDGSMFAAITQFAKADFFEQHRYIQFDTLYESMKWEVFAAYETTTDFYYIQTSFRSKRDYAEFLEHLQARAKMKHAVTLSADDQILTLSTCTRANNDKRFVVHARRLQ